MGITSGTVPSSLQTTSKNQPRRDVFGALTCVSTTDSGLITIPEILKAFPRETPIRSQYTPLKPLLYGRYPSPKNVVLPLSGCRPHSGCDPDRGNDLLLYQSYIKTQQTSIVAWVRG